MTPISPYHQGYPAGKVCGSFYRDRVLQQVPKCPFPSETQDYWNWFQGIIDNIKDREASLHCRTRRHR